MAIERLPLGCAINAPDEARKKIREQKWKTTNRFH